MAAPMRLATCLGRILCQNRTSVPITGVWRRGYKKTLQAELVRLYNLREERGPPPEKHRSEWRNWNYDAEITAFAKRLGEYIQKNTLQIVFSHKSYVDKEKKKMEDLGIDLQTVEFNLEHNEELAKKGRDLTSVYVKAYLRHIYPSFFEEGISCVHDYLMSEETLSYIGRNLGIADLMLCSDFPAQDSSVVRSLVAFIGAIDQDQGRERSERFVRDFILPQLIGVDINEKWNLVNPMGLLSAILNSQNRGLPEPRLLWQAASETIMAVYHVGIYSDRELIGKAPGETVSIAEEMAARDALKNLTKTSDSRPSLILGKLAENLDLDYERRNVSAREFLDQYLPRDRVNVTGEQ